MSPFNFTLLVPLILAQKHKKINTKLNEGKFDS